MCQYLKDNPIQDYSVDFYDTEDKRKEETTGKSAYPEPARPCMGYRKNQQACDDPPEETALETQHTGCLR
jgi:hypothetical protein